MAFAVDDAREEILPHIFVASDDLATFLDLDCKPASGSRADRRALSYCFVKGQRGHLVTPFHSYGLVCATPAPHDLFDFEHQPPTKAAGSLTEIRDRRANVCTILNKKSDRKPSMKHGHFRVRVVQSRAGGGHARILLRAGSGAYASGRSVKGVAAMLMTSIIPPKNPLHEGRGINNRLLLALPPATLDRILRVSEPVSLVRGQRLDRADQPIKHIHFINRGLVCIVKTLEDGRTVEIGATGTEGVANLLPFVGIHTTLLDVVVQIPGTALRMGCDDMRRELEHDEAFRQVTQNHVRFGLSELARHIACSRLYHIEQRCCRWLLIAHDHALSEEFPLTHEFLAMMLGYQRAGVSIVMSSLAKAGLIKHQRAKVTIIDRPGLEAAACECYREMQDELNEFLPPIKMT